MATSKTPNIPNGEAISGDRETRNLGLIMDSELRIESHIEEVARNGADTLGPD